METKKNTLGTVVLNPQAQEYLLKLASFLEAKAYSPMTARNYMAEMRYIFAYYNHLNPEQLTQDHIAANINYIKQEHGVGRDECRMCAQSFGEARWPFADFLHAPSTLALTTLLFNWSTYKARSWHGKLYRIPIWPFTCSGT